MYIKEDITIDILRNNGFTVNSNLAGFIQDILNTKYDFISPSILNKQYRDVLSASDFAILMYIFNCLILIENMEIDHSCFELQYYESKTYRIPQDNGFDVIYSGMIVSPFFIKSPSFMINNIVHPVSYNTKTAYLKLVYLFIKTKYDILNLDILLPFGESIKQMFIEASKQNVSFDKIADKLILSQFPHFSEYMISINDYLKTLLRVEFEPSVIKNKKINTNIVFKSNVFNSMKEGIKIDEKYLNDSYDKALIDKYYNYSLEAIKYIQPIFNNNLYAYPNISDVLIYPYNKEIDYDKLELLYRIMFNSEIYFLVFNKIMPESFKETKEWSRYNLENSHSIQSSYYSVLKAFYFSYHMKFNENYGELYSNTSFKPRNVILKEEFKYNKLKEDIYYPVWTLNQCNSINNRDTLLSLILKTVWHNNKFIMKKVEAPIRNLLRERNNDMYIFKNLNTLYKQFTPKDTGFDKGSFRYNEILKTGVFDKFKKNNKNVRYLDFGGGIGDVGASIAKNLGFLKENSFVTDIQNWLGKEHTEEYSKYITYRYLKTNDLPFENESIDFITCLQVLHHIPDKKYTISQLHRILKKGGLLLIREHNCETIQDQMLIDLEHSLHAFVVDEQGQDYLQNYNDTYMSKPELDNMMTGFKKVTDKITFPEDKGITKYYYSLWEKQPVQQLFKKNWADYSDDED